MKARSLVYALAGVLVAGIASAQTVGTIHLPQAVLADGKPLAPGAYQIRVTSDHPVPAPGASSNAECWIEFVKGQAVVAREVATVIPNSEMAAIAKGPGPKPNDARVDLLKGGEYVRAWINRDGTNYIINLPIVGEARP